MEKIEETEEIKNNENAENKDIFERKKLSALSSRDNILINNDMKYFKNELLKELKNIKQEIFSKLTKYVVELNEKIKKESKEKEELDSKIDLISKNIDNKITNFLTEKNRYNFDRIIADIKESITKNDIKILTLKQELNSHKDNYESMIKNNILYQGVIGPGCRHRNMHQFIDFLNTSLNNLNSLNTQNASEMRSFKNIIENRFNNINAQITDLILGYKAYINQNMKELEKKIGNEMKLYDNKLMDIRTINIQNADNIENKLKKIDEEYDNLNKLENNINQSNEKVMNEINESNNKIKEIFDKYDNEFNEIKTKYDDMINTNKEIKSKLNNLNLFYKKNIFDFGSEKKKSKLDSKSDINNIENESVIGRYKDQSTETLRGNFTKIEKTKIENDKESSQKSVSKIYLKIGNGKNSRKGSKKILKNERLEKYKFLYENEYNNNYRSLDNDSSYNNYENNSNNNLEKKTKRASSSIPYMRNKNKRDKNKVEKYTSKDLYETGLLVNFNSRIEENNYINNLKTNALCLKLLEKGVNLEQIYFNEFANKSSIIPGEYYKSSKNKEKKRHHHSNFSNKDNNHFNSTFYKKINSNIEKNKYNEYMKKGENDTTYLIKEKENQLYFRNPYQKIKIKNLNAIE